MKEYLKQSMEKGEVHDKVYDWFAEGDKDEIYDGEYSAILIGSDLIVNHEPTEEYIEVDASYIYEERERRQEEANRDYENMVDTANKIRTL